MAQVRRPGRANVPEREREHREREGERRGEQDPRPRDAEEDAKSASGTDTGGAAWALRAPLDGRLRRPLADV